MAFFHKEHMYLQSYGLSFQCLNGIILNIKFLPIENVKFIGYFILLLVSLILYLLREKKFVPFQYSRSLVLCFFPRCFGL